MVKKFSLVITAIFVLSSFALGFPFGGRSGSVREQAMGGAGVAFAEGASAVDWNPAGLSWLRAPIIGGSHCFWSGVEGISQEYLVVGIPVKPGKIGVGVSWLGQYALLESRYYGESVMADNVFAVGVGMIMGSSLRIGAVSYTHLTLPTKA